MGDVAGEAISASLQAAGLSSQDVTSAVQAYTGLDAGEQNSILQIASGNISLATCAPLIAGALSATGIGAAGVAVVAAGIWGAQILDKLGLFSPPAQNCNWYVGSVCITRTRPDGPSDPQWVTFDQFVGPIDETDVLNPFAMGQLPLNVKTADGITDAAFPFFRQTMFGELRHIQGGVGIDGFKRAFYEAWKKGKEFEINGYRAPADVDLLGRVVTAWNATHTNASTYVLQPVGSYDPNGPAPYINLLMGGVITGTRIDASGLTINTGPTVSYTKQQNTSTHFIDVSSLLPPVQVKVSTPAPVVVAPKPPTPSPIKKVAVTTAGVAVAGAAGLWLYSYITQQTFGAVTGRLWDEAKGIWKGFGLPTIFREDVEPSRGGRQRYNILGPERQPRKKTSMKVQALIFDKELWSPKKAVSWAKKHGYRTTKLTQTEHSYRLRQVAPSQMQIMRTIEFGKGIKAVVGR